MTVKDHLSQVFNLHRLIKAKETHIQQLNDMRESIAGGVQTDTRVQTSLKLDRMGEFVAKILDAEEECKQDIVKLLTLQQEIEESIEAVSHVDSRIILYERYVNLKRWEDIAADNHYSLKWVYVLHKRGLMLMEQAVHKKSL